MREFKQGDKAEFRTSDTGWTRVYIVSGPLSWAGWYRKADNNYLVQCEDRAARTGPPFLVKGCHLRLVEQWEPCPGTHRVIAGQWTGWDNMERLME